MGWILFLVIWFSGTIAAVYLAIKHDCKMYGSYTNGDLVFFITLSIIGSWWSFICVLLTYGGPTELNKADSWIHKKHRCK